MTEILRFDTRSSSVFKSLQDSSGQEGPAVLKMTARRPHTLLSKTLTAGHWGFLIVLTMTGTIFLRGAPVRVRSFLPRSDFTAHWAQ